MVNLPNFSFEKNPVKGFTLIELIIVLVVISILGTYLSVSLNKQIVHNQLQKTSLELLTKLGSIRPLALKEDTKMLVKFSASSCSVFVDSSGDGIGQKKEYSHRWEISGPVLLGLPKLPPTSAPAGSQIPSPGKAVSGLWANGFLVTNDALGTVNSGSVYLYSPKLVSETYCITSETSQTLKIYVWNGKLWTAL